MTDAEKREWAAARFAKVRAMPRHPLPVVTAHEETRYALLDPPCVFRKEAVGVVRCPCPTGRTVHTVPAYRCTLHGACSVHNRWLPEDPSVELCRLCKDRRAEQPGRRLVWQVGVTAVLQRKSTLLPQTLTSLAKAGWDSPRLFVDGGSVNDWAGVKYPLSVRDKTHALGNWWLGLQELYVRDPLADCYMMVEDDVLFLPRTREYLDAVAWPGGYLNLFTAPGNTPAAGGRKGFFKASLGLGALALVFDRQSVVKMLASPYMIEAFRPVNLADMSRKENSHRSRMHQDGHAMKALRAAGMPQFCHYPSLVQHLGGKSSIMNHGAPDSDCFDPGFNPTELL